MEYLRAALTRLGNPGTYLGVALMMLLVLAAYQVRPRHDIVVGSPTDGPVLRGFNDREKMPDSLATPFRWSGDDSLIVLQGIGAQDVEIALTMSGSRPVGQPASLLMIEVEGSTVFSGPVAPELKEYRFSASRTQFRDGTLVVRLVSNAFTPQNDPRKLGVVLTRIQASPGSGADLFVPVPLDVLGALALAALLLGVWLSLLGWGTGGVLAGTALLSTLSAGLLVWDRLWLTSLGWYHVWPQALVAAGVFTGLAWTIGGFLIKRFAGREVGALAFRVVLTAMLVAFAVRLAGQLHPQIFIVDLFYHVHRFEDAQSGKLIYMHVASELAGRDTFYLMTAYIFMMPLQWLVRDIPLAVRLFTVGLGTGSAFMLFFLGGRALASWRAGAISAVLYLSWPLTVLVYSWGLTTNVFAEFFALLIFTLFVVLKELSPRRPAFWLLVALLVVGVLSHPAVVQILSFAILLTCVLMAILGKGSLAAGWKRGAALAGAYALAVGVAYLIYYRNIVPTMLATLSEIGREKAGSSNGEVGLLVGGAVKDRYLGLVIRQATSWSDWFWGGLLGMWHEFWAYFRTWPLVGGVLGFLSLPVLARGGHANERDGGGVLARLKLTALAWGLAALVFAFIGWRFNLYVRYSLFVLPVLSLGVGVLLSKLWTRGQWGRVLALSLTTLLVALAFVLWHFRINYGLK